MSEVDLDHLEKSFGTTRAVDDLSLVVNRGELLSLLGPSGCGKTTILRMIAGFIRPTGGVIRLKDNNVTGIPAHQRNVAMVFQNYALFPHLTVAANIAFGLKRRRMSAGEISSRVGRMLSMMRLDGLRDRLPRELSGGQQQRVAVARALVVEPAVILLDEPFSSLDTKLRESTRFELRALQQQIGITAVLVTHDQQEALSISDRIAVMNAGRLEQVGTPREVYRQPATPFVADFIGRANRIAGGILRPEAIRIGDPAEAAPASCTALGTVEAVAFLGGSGEIIVLTDTKERLTIATDGDTPLRYPPGARIRLRWSPDSIVRFGEMS